MEFILKEPSQQPFMLAKILDVAFRNLDEEERIITVQKKIDEYRKLKTISIEDIFKDLHYKVIVFETCAEKLRFNTIIDTPESKRLLFIAFNETTVYEVALKINDEESSLLDISSYDSKKISTVLNFAKTQTSVLKCDFQLGSIVRIEGQEKKQPMLFCGTTKDGKYILLNEKNEYTTIRAQLFPAEDSTTSIELDNIFQEIQSLAAKEQEVPQSFGIEVENFNQEFIEEQIKSIESS